MSRCSARIVLAFVAATSALAPSRAGAESHRHGRPFPRPTLPWLAAQIVPSPGVLVTERGAWFHVRWQLTPLALALGVRRGVFPLRTTVIEPGVRVGGSVEWFVDPEYTARPGPTRSQWSLRTGVRTYAPLVQHGEYLAASFAVSACTSFDGDVSVGYEAGVYVLMGLFGLQTTYSPRTRDGQSLLATLSVRYF